MGKKIRITRKRLKEDEIRSYWLQLLTWAQQNRKPLLIGTATVVIVFLFSLAYRQRTATQVASANLLISRAQTEIQYALFAEEEQAREKLFGAAEEKLEIARELYRRSGLVPYATFLLGNIAFFRNDYDEAERLYQEFLDAADGPLEKADGYIALGYTYENKFFLEGKESDDRVWLDRALDSYTRAENLTSGTMQHYLAMFGRARLYDLQEDRIDEAKELYRRLASERQLAPPKRSADVARSPNVVLLDEMERMRRLFTLAQTARLRLDQLEASD